MPMKRRVDKSRDTPRDTPRAVELFEQYLVARAQCSCKGGQRFECPACRRRLELDEQIGLECKTPIWQYPCIENPRATNPYERWHANYDWWEERPLAPRELWLALEEALEERQRKAAAEQVPEPSLPIN